MIGGEYSAVETLGAAREPINQPLISLSGYPHNQPHDLQRDRGVSFSLRQFYKPFRLSFVCGGPYSSCIRSLVTPLIN